MKIGDVVSYEPLGKRVLGIVTHIDESASMGEEYGGDPDEAVHTVMVSGDHIGRSWVVNEDLDTVSNYATALEMAATEDLEGVAYAIRASDVLATGLKLDGVYLTNLNPGFSERLAIIRAFDWSIVNQTNKIDRRRQSMSKTQENWVAQLCMLLDDFGAGDQA